MYTVFIIVLQHEWVQTIRILKSALHYVVSTIALIDRKGQKELILFELCAVQRQNARKKFVKLKDLD